MKLFKSDGSEVQVGDRILTFRGQMVEIVSFREPQHAASSGRVVIKDADGMVREVFPTVVDLVIK